MKSKAPPSRIPAASLPEKTASGEGADSSLKPLVPPATAALLNRLATAGDIWLVGGSVDDFLQGKAFREIDATTPLAPGDLRRLGGTAIGGQHHTHAWRNQELVVEISPFRGDSLADDLQARDFSMTSTAIRWRDGATFDPTGGRRDRDKRVVRANRGGASIADDPLRILRAFRRVAQGYRLEPRTAAAMRRSLPALAETDPERIGGEMLKLLLAPKAGQALRGMRKFPGLLATIDPVFGKMAGGGFPGNHRYDIWTHSTLLIDRLPRDPALRLAALMHDVGKTLPPPGSITTFGNFYIEGHALRSAAYADNLLKRWAIQRESRGRALALVHAHTFSPARLLAATGLRRRWLAEHEAILDDLLLFRRADRWAAGYNTETEDLAALKKAVDRERGMNFPRRPSELNVDAVHLFSACDVAPRGRNDLLLRLWDWVLEAPKQRNVSEAILARAQALLANPLEEGVPARGEDQDYL